MDRSRHGRRPYAVVSATGSGLPLNDHAAAAGEVTSRNLRSGPHAGRFCRFEDDGAGRAVQADLRFYNPSQHPLSRRLRVPALRVAPGKWLKVRVWLLREAPMCSSRTHRKTKTRWLDRWSRSFGVEALASGSTSPYSGQGTASINKSAAASRPPDTGS